MVAVDIVVDVVVETPDDRPAGRRARSGHPVLPRTRYGVPGTRAGAHRKREGMMGSIHTGLANETGHAGQPGDGVDRGGATTTATTTGGDPCRVEKTYFLTDLKPGTLALVECSDHTLAIYRDGKPWGGYRWPLADLEKSVNVYCEVNARLKGLKGESGRTRKARSSRHDAA